MLDQTFLIAYDMDHPLCNHVRFTSAMLKEDLAILGYPKVSIWIRTVEKDVDVFAYLEVS